jgi:hypothetical protein
LINGLKNHLPSMPDVANHADCFNNRRGQSSLLSYLFLSTRVGSRSRSKASKSPSFSTPVALVRSPPPHTH